ncbi:BNR-4 repeat-containing protein [Mycetocola tolaasinivorans]|uniref:BNR-4 repeat-containing protein n=1 Tax=Mycetocola tolaasinivorans TaxID=76635 RepID=UPI0011C3D2F3|nr:BNR-4 repeat-containing protein [Mycetocola tolaasinivorans]
MGATSLSCQVPGEKPVAQTELALSTEPEKMLDAHGVAAKAYAGFYTDQAIATDGTSTYVAFYAADKKLTVGSRTGDTGPWAFVTLQNGADETETLKGDTHNNIAMSMAPDGTGWHPAHHRERPLLGDAVLVLGVRIGSAELRVCKEHGRSAAVQRQGGAFRH